MTRQRKEILKETGKPNMQESVGSHEPTSEGAKTFYCVTTKVDDKGTVQATITSAIEAVCKPENSFQSFKRKDIYHDWFDSIEEAEDFVREAKEA